MEKSFERFKGIHPGAIIDRELKKRMIKSSPFAQSISTHRQILHDIIKGKRGLPVSLALKVDKIFGIEEGTFALLQTYYDIKKAQSNNSIIQTPNLDKIRKILFWDTDMSKIDWNKQYIAIIQRVYERGNIEEKEEILRFYGQDKIKQALNYQMTKPMSLQQH